MSSLHVGKAGQLVTMAESLMRGYNTAMPEVDTGDDIFVVHDRAGTFWRIQVKTAVGKPWAYGYSGRFALDVTQLERPKTPDLFYVLALQASQRWEFVVLSRRSLHVERQQHAVGNVSKGLLLLNLRFRPTDVMCSQRNWQSFRNNWEEWPVIRR
jgi:hypothetical protein